MEYLVLQEPQYFFYKIVTNRRLVSCDNSSGTVTKQLLSRRSDVSKDRLATRGDNNERRLEILSLIKYQQI